ncbi:hypothetical protein [Actinomadura sp. KC216]|uniref:hypothetical protein n=1 Tax=Actinomadura sp. KC216 TaxID=2530370 RepID=UPI001A9F3A16|nr:hypothetical protein [Actinomadura sp. KC216]
MKYGAFVAGLVALAVVAGCSAEGDDVSVPVRSASGSAVPTPEAATVPPGWHRIESQEVGLSIAVPKGWIDLDVETGEFTDALKKAGISGAPAEAIEKGAAALAGRSILYVVDAAGADGGYVDNISAVCAPGGGVKADQLENAAKVGLARLGADDIRSSSLTIGGMPAAKVSYSLNAGVDARAVQFRILAPEDTLCAVTFGMKPGTEIKELDRIAGTVRPLM